MNSSPEITTQIHKRIAKLFAENCDESEIHDKLCSEYPEVNLLFVLIGIIHREMTTCNCDECDFHNPQAMHKGRD